MFLFLILVISCWVVAASLVAEKTNAGVAVFITDITSMCGLGSDGAAAILSQLNELVIMQCHCPTHAQAFLHASVIGHNQNTHK